MASRVNVKFITAMLAAVGVVVLALGGIAYFALQKSGDDNARLGDTAAAAGDWEKAVMLYSRAVAKDQSNLEWLEKWLDAIGKTTPPTRHLYIERYRGEYLLALRGIAEADRQSPDGFLRYLDEQRRGRLIGRSDLPSAEHMLTHVEEVLGQYRGEPEAGRVLRRYRALAMLDVIMLRSDPPREDIETAAAEFETALAANPADAESVVGLSRLDRIVAENHRRRNELDDEAARRRTARDRLEAFIRAFPPAPAARLALFDLDLDDFARGAARGTTRSDAFQALRPQLQQVVDAALGERAEKLDRQVAIGVAELATFGLEAGANHADQVFTHALSARPNDAQLHAAWGLSELLRGNTDMAVQRLQKVIDLPDPPVSLDGVVLHHVRGVAAARQADAMFAAWESSTDAESRARYAERAREYRERLTRFVAESDLQLLSVDGRLKFIEGDLDAARKMLSDYNSQTGQRDQMTVHLMAEILLQQGNTGAAEKALERVVELNPHSITAIERLAAIAIQQRDFAAAVRYYQGALNLKPNNTALQENLRIARDLEAGGAAIDPVMALLNEVRVMLSSVAPDFDAAATRVEAGLRTNKHDPRLSMLLVEIRLAQGDKDGAVEVASAGLAAHPEHAGLLRMNRALNDPDPVGAQLKLIDDSSLPEMQKRLSRFMTLRNAGRPEEAAVELTEAAALDPVHPTVVELQFTAALERRDAEELNRLVAIAEEKNFDQARGMVFRARRDLSLLTNERDAGARRRKLESIAVGLRSALEQDRLNAYISRMLGMVQLELGQTVAAIETLRRTLEIRPNDVVTNTLLVRGLAAAGELEAALATARAAEPFAGRDPAFARVLLQMESEAPGGDRQKAIDARTRMARSKPDDLVNKTALASLLIDAREFDQAETLIAEIREHDPGNAATMLAAVQARRGDREAAARTVRDYLESHNRPAGDYVVAAMFLARVVHVDDALALLESARGKQDPKHREIDRAIGDLHFDTGRSEEAIAAYRSVLEAGTPADHAALSLRLVEAFLRMGRFDQADELLASIRPDLGSDGVYLMLEARTAVGLGNTDRARRCLDRAVAAAPDNPLVYLMRAEFTASDPALERDTEADLEQVLKLEPRFMQARKMLANMHFGAGRNEKGLEQVRRALSVSPADVELRMGLVRKLLELNLQSEAMDVVEDALRLFKDDMEWKLRAARVFASAGRYERATELAGQLFEKFPTPEVAEFYVVALTSGTRPDLNRAMQVLSAPDLKIDDNWRLQMVRARVHARGPNPDRASADVQRAWSRIDPESAQQVNEFFVLLSAVHKTTAEQIAELRRLERTGKFSGWALLQASVLRSASPDTAAQAKADLRQLSDATTDSRLRASAWRTMGGLAYRDRDYNEAVSAFRQGLAYAPDDAELNNNVAYTLGIDLGRPNEAIPYAEKAAAAAQNSPMVLDTLGALYHALGRHETAEPVLERALNLSVAPTEKVPALVHLSAVKIALGDKLRARRLVEQADRLIDANPDLKDLYHSRLKELRQSLDPL